MLRFQVVRALWLAIDTGIKAELMGACQIVHWATMAFLERYLQGCLGGCKDLKSTNQHYLVFPIYTQIQTFRSKKVRKYWNRYWVGHAIEVSILLVASDAWQKYNTGSNNTDLTLGEIWTYTLHSDLTRRSCTQGCVCNLQKTVPPLRHGTKTLLLTTLNHLKWLIDWYFYYAEFTNTIQDFNLL